MTGAKYDRDLANVLYALNVTPEHWVGSDDQGVLWLFPARADGWSARVPYRGHAEALRATEAWWAYGTGFPAAAAGKAVTP